MLNALADLDISPPSFQNYWAMENETVHLRGEIQRQATSTLSSLSQLGTEHITTTQNHCKKSARVSCIRLGIISPQGQRRPVVYMLQGNLPVYQLFC